MKKIIFIIFSLLFIITFNVNANEIKPNRNLLIQKANTGNISAMIELDNYYSFGETKQGLANYKRWYPLVLKQHNADLLLAFSRIIKKYQDMFINGEIKYKSLLDKAKEEGSKEALFDLLEYYKDNKTRNDAFKTKYEETIKLIFKDTSKKNLQKFRQIAKKIYDLELLDKINSLRIKKGYLNSSLENLKELNQAYRKSQYRGYDKNRLPNIINKIIASNSIGDIYYASNKIKAREHDFREKLLHKLLELNINEKLKGKVYFDLADNIKRRKEHIFKVQKYWKKELKKAKTSEEKEKFTAKIKKLEEERKTYTKEKTIKLYEKASVYNNLNAMKKLFYIYDDDLNKYGEKYSLISSKLRQTNEGLKFYLQRFPHSVELFEKLATAGDRDIIVRLAKQNLDDKESPYEKTALKWQRYILKSNDSKLYLKARKLVTSRSYKNYKNAKAFLKKLDYKQKEWKNILVQRELIEELKANRNYEEALKALELAYLFGDTKSALKLASKKTFIGYDWEYVQKDKIENTKKDIFKGIEIYENLAQKGEIKALKELGELYSSKKYMNKALFDNKKALTYYEKALALGDNESAIKAMKIYTCKTCGFYNIQKAIKILEILVKKGTNTKYAYKLGKLYYEKSPYQNFQKAKVNFEISKSYYYLAKLYYDKNALEHKPKKAFAYLERCVQYSNTNFKCNYLIGMAYKNGLGVKKDLEKSIQHLHNASYMLSGKPVAALELGKIYESIKDYKRAKELYLRVAKYNKIQILKRLNDLYKKGLIKNTELKPLIDDYLVQYKIFAAPAKARKISQCLGFIYEKGLGVKANPKKAKEWYSKAKV